MILLLFSERINHNSHSIREYFLTETEYEVVLICLFSTDVCIFNISALKLENNDFEK